MALWRQICAIYEMSWSRLPWIYKVNTRRRWPAEIEVVLVEQRPLARWGDTGYLNHQGHFFAADAGWSV